MPAPDLLQSGADFTPSPEGRRDGQRPVYTVSGLNAEVRDLLHHGFPLLWVEGELSNLARPGSGHWYFTLKDERAQVRCAMFRSRNKLVNFQPEDGGQVVVRAKVGLYEPRGAYQLIVEHMEPTGDGALRRAFEQLKNRLEQEGLFAPEHKKALPPVPRRIGVITSGTGAALRDVISVLTRRFPLGDVLVLPVPVQGTASAPALVDALERAPRETDCDVLILTRGGGSLEDLWSFNEESVARAVHACPLPVVSAVGHEVDFTIADFVADVRAPTPSAAAEVVSPDQEEWQNRLAALTSALQQHQQRRLTQCAQQLNTLQKRLNLMHPGRRLQDRMQRLDEMETRLRRAASQNQAALSQHVQQIGSRLRSAGPARRIAATETQRKQLHRRLLGAQRQQLERAQARLGLASRSLNTVSPLATLGRGYAIAQDSAGKIVRDAGNLATGDELRLRLHHGEADCHVTTIRPEDSGLNQP